MRVLIIDNEPIRALPVISAGHDVKIAHGFKQVEFWLRCKFWQPDIICLDNDMSAMSGLDIAREFAEDLFYCPVRIWSRNNVVAPLIRDLLIERAKVFGLKDNEIEIIILPFNSNVEPAFWAAQE